jgi:ubiquinone/menaquinone biosynthesis C-methylase UbiE
VVLDLGSGAGLDAFVARRIVGKRGRVIGVDMTPEMIALARENAAKLGYDNVEFRLGEIEHLPIETTTVDVVVSNCVLNLVPNKARAFSEIFRVLRPGRISASRISLRPESFPSRFRQAAALYVGCIAGALPRGHYLRVIKEAGFENAEVAETKPIELPDDVLYRHIDKSQIAAFRGSGVSLQSITVRARKPARERV